MDTLRFYFVTWNVATKNPGQDLNSLLDFPSQFNKNKPLPDFYVIGLQEVKSQPQNMLMDTLFSDQWTSMFNKILCRQGFIIAKSIRLQGIILLVYTQMKHVTHLREIEAQYTKTGLGGLWGNKGAVSVRFNIYGCSVCLVNCHLAAHEHLLAERISDYNTIIKDHAYHISETSNILYHDYVFWIGDLNFRTDHPAGSISSEEIVTALGKVEKDKYAALLKHDQLLAVMDSGDAFSEFSEPEIRFPPTYKFNIGTDDYDVKRKPSWTDRILYKVIANNYENITLRADLVSYNHIPHYTVSDHKPVVAQFNIKIRNGFTRAVTETKAPRSGIRMRSALVAPVVAEAAVDEASSSVEQPSYTDANEAFSNYTVKTVEFAPVTRVWYIGDADFRTQCTLSPDVEVNANDWIGIYDANFHNLDDYIAYEYLSKVQVQPPTAAGQPRTITLSFPVGSGVRTPGFYRFIYFSQPNNDVRSVLGISEPFEVSSKEDKLVALDVGVEPSTSAGPSKPSTATSDIFTDFTGLDVAKLSRHFSNDLSID
ncbi:inositol polyphosphate 5-phosphatase K-like isoform X1 [Aricia agestis]|uniref:inositol polyphosphate 5-phosphatase K-like isoform X1 n=1 Tax=Aricia agestis TaxID=91739 RepID=UPI001C20B903|nr:inositol polyphosphate 5-phosphatase K-like isoform X1 [Aricia agestis]